MKKRIGDIRSKEGYRAWHPDKIAGNVTSTCRVDGSAGERSRMGKRKREKQGRRFKVSVSVHWLCAGVVCRLLPAPDDASNSLYQTEPPPQTIRRKLLDVVGLFEIALLARICNVVLLRWRELVSSASCQSTCSVRHCPLRCSRACWGSLAFCGCVASRTWIVSCQRHFLGKGVVKVQVQQSQHQPLEQRWAGEVGGRSYEGLLRADEEPLQTYATTWSGEGDSRCCAHPLQRNLRKARAHEGPRPPPLRRLSSGEARSGATPWSLSGPLQLLAWSGPTTQPSVP